MHVLFLASYYPNRVRKTVGSFIRRHAGAISRYARISILAIEKDDTLKEPYEIVYSLDQGNPTYIVYYRDIQSDIPLLGSLRTFLSSFRALRICIARIRKERGDYDFVHLNICYSLGLLAIYLKFLKRKPYLFTEHSSLFLNDNVKTFPKYKVFLIRYIFKFALRLSTVSDYLGKSIVELGYSKSYVVIPNIVPVDTFTITQKIARGKLCFIHVSNLIPLKGCEQMLQACRTLADKNLDFRFIIIGGAGIELDRLIALTHSLSLLNYVEFTGEVDSITVASYMADADFFLMNSEFETFCLVMMEAMACGLPIIAPDNTVFSENINPERGVLMADRSAESIVKAVLQMIEHLEEFDRNKIRDYVKEKYTEESVAKKFLDFYNSAGVAT